jgi:hypothetical protein
VTYLQAALVSALYRFGFIGLKNEQGVCGRCDELQLPAYAAQRNNREWDNKQVKQSKQLSWTGDKEKYLPAGFRLRY